MCRAGHIWRTQYLLEERHLLRGAAAVSAAHVTAFEMSFWEDGYILPDTFFTSSNEVVSVSD
eukprot:3484970-Prymnesium_polylepis.1